MLRKGMIAALAAAVAFTGPASAQTNQRAAQRQQVLEQFGGAYEGQASAYVRRVGDRVAQAAGRRDCAFTVVNSDVVNAFATPPACDVYVTRGLLSIMNSEAELAAVLGHEVGHVTANHAGRRQTRSVLTGLGAALVGALTKSNALAQLASQAGQLNVLSYSRSQEFEADDLGLRSLTATGYSPYALADMLRALQANDEITARLRGQDQASAAPAWARTHPLTGERVSRAIRSAEATRTPPGALPENEEAFYAAIDGMRFGDDPEQGYVMGERFVHPTLGIGFEAPQGFVLTNSPRAVKIQGPGGVTGEFSAGRLQGGLEDYAVSVLRRLAGNTPVQMGRPDWTRINGIEAVVLPARAQTSNGVVDVTVAAYADGAQGAYHFVTLAPAGRAGIFDPLFGSFHRLTERERAGLRPRVIEVVTVRPGDTVQSLAERMAVEELKTERFLAMNDIAPDERLRPGQKVKLVSFARR